MKIDFVLMESIEGRASDQVAELMKAAFGMGAEFTTETVLRSSAPADPSLPSLYVAAMENEQMIAFNAFATVPLRSATMTTVAYQSCWSATHPDHQGRGIWVKLMNEAKELLAQRGAFIFGVPNNNSHPIFIRKLGYREVPIVSTSLLAIPMLRGRNVDFAKFHQPKGLVPDERAIAASKNLGDAVCRFENRSAFAWGKKRIRRIRGVPVPYFFAGGVQAGPDGESLEGLFRLMLRSSGAYAQVILSATHELAPIFPDRRVLSGVNPFIVLDLQGGSDDPLNMMFGVTDVF